jgi:hypothetical protein
VCHSRRLFRFFRIDPFQCDVNQMPRAKAIG